MRTSSRSKLVGRRPRSTDAGAVLVVLDGSLPGSPAAGLTASPRSTLRSWRASTVTGARPPSLSRSRPPMPSRPSRSAWTVPSRVRCSSSASAGVSRRQSGTAQAKAILFGSQPVTGQRLAASGALAVSADPEEAAVEAASRLAANPGAHLLVRSLRAAARSAPAQAAAYDSELLQLLGE